MSQTGTLVYRKGAASELSVVDWIDRSGKRVPFLSKRGRYGWLRLSPDGRRLAITVTESGVSSILIYDPKTDGATRVTTGPGDYTGLTWLPNGGVVFFGGATGIGWVHSDRPGDATRLTNVRSAQIPWSVAPGGRRLAYYERNPDTGFDLWTAPLAANDDSLHLGAPEPF